MPENDARAVSGRLQASGHFDGFSDSRVLSELIPGGAANFSGDGNFAAQRGDEKSVARLKEHVLVTPSAEQVFVDVYLNRVLPKTVELETAEGTDFGGAARAV